MTSFTRELPAWVRLRQATGLRLLGAREDPAVFGNSVIELECEELRFRLVRDRGEWTCDVLNGRNGAWSDVESVLRNSGVAVPARRPADLEALLDTLRESWPRIEKDHAPGARTAFPTALAEDAEALLRRFPALAEKPTHGLIRVELGGEVLQLPARIYAEATQLGAAKGLGVTSQRMLDCLFTRHHDGWVREACVRRLLGAPEPWVIPFIALLLGEYVLEIVQLIESRVNDLDVAAYRAFFAQNPALYRRTVARATSYWNCYHRAAYPERSRYPALRALERLSP